MRANFFLASLDNAWLECLEVNPIFILVVEMTVFTQLRLIKRIR